MKIRIRYFLLSLAVVGLFGYVVGCFWPVGSLMYPLSESPVDKGQNLSNLIALFAAFFTLLAVIVALFKDEIVGCFKNVDVSGEALCSTVEETFDEIPRDGDPVVSKYFNQIIFKNTGNVNALDCELIIDRIQFKSRTEIYPHSIQLTQKILQLSGQDKTYIPKDGGTREADLVEITSSEDPNGNRNTQLLVAGTPVPSRDGTWMVELCLIMSNATRKHFQFEIVWDGNWHDNKNHMQISVKKI